MYYLSSGSNPKYNEFMGAYCLQWDMIRYAKEKGIERYNFYGITGDFGEDAKIMVFNNLKRIQCVCRRICW